MYNFFHYLELNFVKFAMLLGGLGEIEEINSCGKQNLLNIGLGKVLITKLRFSQINGKSVNKR